MLHNRPSGLCCTKQDLKKRIFLYSPCIFFLSTIKPSWANKDKLLKSSWLESLFSRDQPRVRTWLFFHIFPPFLYPDFWHPLLLSWLDFFIPCPRPTSPNCYVSINLPFSKLAAPLTLFPFLTPGYCLSPHSPLPSILLALSWLSVIRQCELSESLGTPPSHFHTAVDQSLGSFDTFLFILVPTKSTEECAPNSPTLSLVPPPPSHAFTQTNTITFTLAHTQTHKHTHLRGYCSSICEASGFPARKHVSAGDS